MSHQAGHHKAHKADANVGIGGNVFSTTGELTKLGGGIKTYVSSPSRPVGSTPLTRGSLTDGDGGGVCCVLCDGGQLEASSIWIASE